MENIYDREELKAELDRILSFYDEEKERWEEIAEERAAKYEDALKVLYEAVRKFFDYDEKQEHKDWLKYQYLLLRDRYEEGGL